MRDPAAAAVADALDFDGSYRSNILAGHVLTRLCEAGLIEPGWADSELLAVAHDELQNALAHSTDKAEVAARIVVGLRERGHLT